MAKIESAESFSVGDRVVLVDRSERRSARRCFREGDVATVKWFYESDVNPGEVFVYIEFDRPIMHFQRTDAMGNPQKGDPVRGPFAFRPQSLRAA